VYSETITLKKGNPKMAYTKMKNAYLLVDAVKQLDDAKKTSLEFPAHQRMVDYWENKIQELTRRVYR